MLPCARTSILSDLVQCVHRRNGRENDLCRRKNSPQPKIQAFVQTAVWTLQTGLIRTSRGARPIAVRAAPNKPAVRAMSTKERLPDNLRLPGPRSLSRNLNLGQRDKLVTVFFGSGSDVLDGAFFKALFKMLLALVDIGGSEFEQAVD